MTREETDQIVKEAMLDIRRFSVLYDEFYVLIFRYIYKRIGHREQTADITSGVFLKAMENLKKYQFRGAPFSAWLIRIACNEVSDFYRQKKVPVTYNLQLSEVRNIAYEMDQTGFEENWQTITTAIAALRPDEMNLLHMRYFDGFSYTQISEVLSINESLARVKVHRIIHSIKKKIEHQPYGK